MQCLQRCRRSRHGGCPCEAMQLVTLGQSRANRIRLHRCRPCEPVGDPGSDRNEPFAGGATTVLSANLLAGLHEGHVGRVLRTTTTRRVSAFIRLARVVARATGTLPAAARLAATTHGEGRLRQRQCDDEQCYAANSQRPCKHLLRLTTSSDDQASRPRCYAHPFAY
jgi:hypothetical protein